MGWLGSRLAPVMAVLVVRGDGTAAASRERRIPRAAKGVGTAKTVRAGESVITAASALARTAFSPICAKAMFVVSDRHSTAGHRIAAPGRIPNSATATVANSIG